ncbi:hypothetical protein HA402_003648 [Bradysia odoriphaga]|nr:hypothetical protein HA402_003648 [Bradysia odoriphaga]
MLRERRRHANFKPNRKLDRKSSRGMLYENEELRLRTININAEVDRGQSDIRKLRRENDQLRREIWCLRDEYDKLDKLLGGNRSKDLTTVASTTRPDVDDKEYYSDDSNSCDTSNEEEDYSDKETADNHQNAQKSRENLHVNFDHLSIVSEENTPNCDETLSSSTGHSRGNETPMAEFQSNIPSLAHFENLRYDEIGPNLDSSGEIQRSTSTPTTGETVISVNGLHTPDVQRHSKSGFNPFNFLKSAIKVQNRVGPADLCVSNVIPSTMAHEEGTIKAEPIYAQVQKASKSNGACSPGVFQRGGNLEDLLQDIELLSSDIQQMQKQNQQYHSHLSLNRLPTSNDTIPKPKSNLLQNKAFRSEMNLMLSFEGDQPKITPLASTTQDSPPPTLPNPMILLPPTLPYTGFEEDLKRPDKASPSSEPTEAKENGFALIRRRLFNKKNNIPHENPKIVVEKPPLVLKRNDSSSSEQNAEVPQQKPLKPLETRRKSRRISLHLNGSAIAENSSKLKTLHSTKLNRRASHADHHLDDLPIFLNGMNGINIPGIMNSSIKPPKHNHRKMSQDSVKMKKGRRHSDGGSLLGHDSAYEFGTSMSERYSNSLESSRESSTSLNIPTRRVSFGKKGGKIPWCGCWGII